MLATRKSASKTSPIRRRLSGLLLAVALGASGAAEAAAAGREVSAAVIKRGRSRPAGVHNIGVYVQSKAEYRRQWKRFGYRSSRPPMNFQRRRLAFLATSESSSCPLRFRRAAVDRDERRVIIHLSDGAGPDDECTDDLAPRSFVVSLRRSELPRGDLTIGIRRH